LLLLMLTIGSYDRSLVYAVALFPSTEAFSYDAVADGAILMITAARSCCCDFDVSLMATMFCAERCGVCCR